MMVVTSIYTSGSQTVEKRKNSVVNINWHCFFLEWWFTCEKLTLNVVYYIHIYSVLQMSYIFTVWEHKQWQYLSFISVNWNVVEIRNIQHRMLAISPATMYINLLNIIPNIANINIRNFYHVIFVLNIKNYDI